MTKIKDEYIKMLNDLQEIEKYKREMMINNTKEFVESSTTFFKYEKAEPLSLSKEHMYLKRGIQSDKSITTKNRIPGFNVTKRYLIDTLSIWNELGIRLHPVKLIDNYTMNQIEGKDYDGELSDITSDGFVEDIPIKLSMNVRTDGSVCMLPVINSDGNVNLQLINKVYLVRGEKRCCAAIYAHEIAHTQLDPGYTKDYLNREAIPAFMEEIFSDVLDKSGSLLQSNRYFKLNLTAKYIDMIRKEEESILKVEPSTYIQSHLESIALANLYFSSNRTIKKEILENVSKVFNGEQDLDNMLNRYECGIDNVPLDIKILKKVKKTR